MNSQQVCLIAGVTMRQLQWWVQTGLVEPTFLGHDRQFTLAQATRVLLIATLRKKDIPLDRARLVLRYWETMPAASWAVLSGRRVLFSMGPAEAALAAAKANGPVVVVQLHRVTDDDVPAPKLKAQRGPKPRKPQRPGVRLASSSAARVPALTKYEQHLTGIANSTAPRPAVRPAGLSQVERDMTRQANENGSTS